MNFYHRNSIFNRDRGYSAVPPFLRTNATPENLQLTFEAVAEAGAGAAAAAAGFGPGDIFFGAAPGGSNGSSSPTDYTYSNARIRGAGLFPGFNFNQFSSSFPEIEYYGGFANFTHELFGDQMILFGDVFYQNASSHDELAPAATNNFDTPGSVAIAIPPRTSGPELGVADGAPTRDSVGLPPGSFNPFNPFQPKCWNRYCGS